PWRSSLGRFSCGVGCCVSGCFALISVVFSSEKSRTPSDMSVCLRFAVVGVLGVHRADIQRFGLLGGMGMFGAGIDAQIGELMLAQGAARQHALDGKLHDAFGRLAGEEFLRRAVLDAADIT